MSNEQTGGGDGLPAGVTAADRLAALDARHQHGTADPQVERWVAAVADAIPELLALGEVCGTLRVRAKCDVVG